MHKFIENLILTIAFFVWCFAVFCFDARKFPKESYLILKNNITKYFKEEETR